MRLKKYVKTSKITTVRIKYGKESFVFSLPNEIAIKRENLEIDLLTQPSKYSFITVLHKRLIARAKETELDMNRTYSERFLYYMTSNKSRYYKDMNSLPTSTVAKELAMADKTYLEACRLHIKTEEDRDILESCVKAFEQRAFLLQTLSANKRKEVN